MGPGPRTERAEVEQARRNTGCDYLLSSILNCGCSKKIYCCNTRGKYFSYACDGRTRKPKMECKQRSIKRDLFEECIWKDLKARAKDIPALEHNLRAAQQLELSSQDPNREELDLVKTKITASEARAAKLARTLSAVDPDGASGRAIKKDIDTNDAPYRKQTKRRDELQDESTSDPQRRSHRRHANLSRRYRHGTG